MNDSLWIEKYRPQNLEDFHGQEVIKHRVQAMIKQESIPHILFAGPAGTGKSTLALIIAKKIFGESWRDNFLELNASDARGIDVIRNEVKDFARTKSLEGRQKIIFLDECDALTREAQQALRRTMEMYANSTRFLLSCNYSSKLIDPIMSRCTVFRFKSLDESELLKIIDHVSSSEGLSVDIDAKKAIMRHARGDVRKVNNLLQSCASINKRISLQTVLEIVSGAHPDDIRIIITLALQKDFIKARTKLFDTMVKQGLSGLDLMKQISEEIIALDIPDLTKAKIIERAGEAEFRMVEGADEFLQLEAFLASLVIL